MPTLFTKIIRGEIPSHKIWEDDRYFSFLDIRPIATGHTLLIPKKEIDYFFDLDEGTMSGLMTAAKKIAAALRQAVPCQKVGIMVAGLEVPHAHVHLVPINSVGELNFSRANPRPPAELEEVAKKIRSFLG